MIYFFGGNPKKKGKHMIFFKIFRERTILLILELFWQLGFCSLCIDDGFLCVVVYSFFLIFQSVIILLLKLSNNLFVDHFNKGNETL